MDELSELLNNIQITNTFDVESSTWVDITHINNPHDFYVRPTIYRKHLLMLHLYGAQADLIDLNTGSKVIFKSKINGTCVRGQILQKQQNLCNIFAQDYGFVENDVKQKYIYWPCYNAPIPGLATRCKLASCKPLGGGNIFSEKAIDAMKFYIGNERARMIVKTKIPDALVVELFNSGPDDVATVMALTGYTHIGFEGNVINVNSLPKAEKLYFEHPQLKVGDKLLVRVQSGKSLTGFYVAEVNDHKKYLEKQVDYSDLLKNVKQLTVDEFRVGISVGVMDGFGKYDRAIIKEITIPESKAIVQLVDIGICKEVHMMKLKPLQSQRYFRLPVTAIFCATEASQIWDNGLQKFLYPGFEFFITISELGHEFDKPHVVKVEPYGYGKHK